MRAVWIFEYRNSQGVPVAQLQKAKEMRVLISIKTLSHSTVITSKSQPGPAVLVRRQQEIVQSLEGARPALL